MTSQFANRGAVPRRVTLADLAAQRAEILALARRHGVHSVRVFGSVARGDSTPASDVDFLVEVEPGRSLLDLGGFLLDVQDLLGVNVDVVTPAGLRDRIRSQVEREAVTL